MPVVSQDFSVIKKNKHSSTVRYVPAVLLHLHIKAEKFMVMSIMVTPRKKTMMDGMKYTQENN